MSAENEIICCQLILTRRIIIWIPKLSQAHPCYVMILQYHRSDGLSFTWLRPSMEMKIITRIVSSYIGSLKGHADVPKCIVCLFRTRPCTVNLNSRANCRPTYTLTANGISAVPKESVDQDWWLRSVSTLASILRYPQVRFLRDIKLASWVSYVDIHRPSTVQGLQTCFCSPYLYLA